MSILLKAGAIEVWAVSRIVAPASFELSAGHPFTIIGETGSGKSLLAQAIVGTLPKGLTARGRVTIGDLSEEADAGERRRLWGHGLAVLPQEPWLSLDPTMRALDQVSESHRFVNGLTAGTAMSRAREALAGLGLAGAEAKYPFQLSGGMAQRVAFAAANAGGAKIVIADEPTKGLDAARLSEVIELLLSDVRQGAALLTITHDLEVARRLGGDVAIMRQGEIVERGSAKDVLADPQHEYTRALLAADPSRWTRRTARPSASEPVLSAQDLAASRGGAKLFQELSIDIRPGEIVGVTGPSGCGKSTLGDVLLGIVNPDSGRIERRSEGKSVRFQKLYQDPPAAFPPHATLRQVLDDVVRRHRLDGGSIAPLMTRLNLQAVLLDRRPGEVSGGELQRFSLLRVLLLEPALVFADEPTSRLDLITQKEMIDLLVDLAENRNCAVLLVSHDEALITKVADRQLRLGEAPNGVSSWLAPVVENHTAALPIIEPA